MPLEIKTANGKKSKKDKPDRLTIDSPTTQIIKGKGKKQTKSKEKLVDVMINLNEDIENKKGQLKSYKKDLIDHTTIKRQDSLDEKTFVKTVDVKGTDTKIQVQFQDRYTPLSSDMENPLKEIFKTKFDSMFTVNEAKTLKEGKQQEIIDLIGKDKYESFFETTKTVSPVKDFQYHYFLMEEALNKDQKETVQKIFDACKSTPAVKYPK